jgi:hypothetical protein
MAAAVILCAGGCGGQALQTSRPPKTISPSIRTTVVFDCGGAAHVRPSTMVLACADAGDTLVRLRWHGWGGERATATGSLSELTCVPSCAAGGVKYYPVSVRVAGLGLQGSRAAYRQLQVSARRGDLGGLGHLVRYSLTPTGPSLDT